MGRYYSMHRFIFRTLVSLSASLPGCTRHDPPAPPVPPDIESLEPQLRSYLQQHIAAAQADRKNAAAHAELALVYEANAFWAPAQQSYENVLRLAPNHALARVHLALSLWHIGEVEAAEAQLLHAVRWQPDLAAAWHRLGHLRLDRGDLTGAIEAFQRVTALAPGEPAGYVSMGAARLQQGEPRVAMELLERAIDMDPSYKMARFLLGQCYVRLGRTEEGRRELERGAGGHVRFLGDAWSTRLRRHARTVTAQLKKARGLFAAGDASGAAEILEAAIAWHPQNVDALNNLAIVYMAGDRVPQAQALLQRAQQVDPHDPFTLTNFALCHLKKNELDEALGFADRAVKLSPQSADARLTRGRVLLQHRRPADAAQEFEQVLRLEPQNSTARIALANVLFSLHQFAKAREHYQAVLARSPNMIPALVRYCETCIHTGDMEEARRTITKLEQIGGANAELTRTAARLRERTGD